MSLDVLRNHEEKSTLRKVENLHRSARDGVLVKESVKESKPLFGEPYKKTTQHFVKEYQNMSPNETVVITKEKRLSDGSVQKKVTSIDDNGLYRTKGTLKTVSGDDGQIKSLEAKEKFTESHAGRNHRLHATSKESYSEERREGVVTASESKVSNKIYRETFGHDGHVFKDKVKTSVKVDHTTGEGLLTENDGTSDKVKTPLKLQ